MEDRIKSINRSIFKLYVGIFAVTAFWFTIMPLMGDDMTYKALTDGMGLHEIFSYAYSYGNGRFLGNTLILLLLKNVFLRGVFKAVVISAVAYMTAKLCDIKTLSGNIVTLFLVLLPAGDYIGELYTWSAGFTNYVVPVCLILSVLCLMKFSKASGAALIPLCAAVFILGTASQLFSENTTVFNIFLAVFIFLSNRKNGKNRFIVNSTYLLAVIIGGEIMLLIPYLAGASEKIKWYRNVSLLYRNEIIKTAVGHFTSILCSVAQLVLLWVILSAAVIVLTKSNSAFSSLKKRNRIFVLGIIISYPSIMIASILFYGFPSEALSEVFGSFVIVGMLLYLIILFITICKWIPTENRKTAITLYLFTVISLCPLLIVEPIGKRTFYLSYIIMVMLTLYLARAAVKLAVPIRFEQIIKKPLCVVLSAVMLVVTCIYSEVDYCSSIRTEYIRAEIEAGASVIHIPCLPHKHMIYNANKMVKDEGLYALFYHDEPGDVKFIIEDDYDEWYEEYYMTGSEQSEGEITDGLS